MFRRRNTGFIISIGWRSLARSTLSGYPHQITHSGRFKAPCGGSEANRTLTRALRQAGECPCHVTHIRLSSSLPVPDLWDAPTSGIGVRPESRGSALPWAHRPIPCVRWRTEIPERVENNRTRVEPTIHHAIQSFNCWTEHHEQYRLYRRRRRYRHRCPVVFRAALADNAPGRVLAGIEGSDCRRWYPLALWSPCLDPRPAVRTL